MAAGDVFFKSITELNRMLVSREVSARELAEAYLDRLEALGPKYNALAALTRKPAIEQAKNVDDDLKRERFRGPLQGIPFGAKDLLAYPGFPTTWGAKPFAAQVFDEKATAIENLEGRGAVLVGKLAMVELAGGGGYEFCRGVHVRTRPQPLGSGTLVWRIVQRFGQRGRRGVGAVRLGFRDLGLHPHPQRLLRHHRASAHLWLCQPPRGDAVELDDG